MPISELVKNMFGEEFKTPPNNRKEVTETLKAENGYSQNPEKSTLKPNHEGKNSKAQRIADSLKSSHSSIKPLTADSLIPYTEHPFKLYSGERLDDMVSSIKEFGIISPIIVRTAEENKYEILSGHNRVNAAIIAGIETIPAIVKDNLTDNEAKLIVTETNLQQRSFSDLTHSERALCLKQHYDAIKCQGKRNDLIKEIETLLNPNGVNASVQVEHRQKSRDKLGNKYSLSATNVTRYIRVSSLITDLLERIDNGEISFLSAYQISFIEDENLQNQIADYLQNGNKLNMKKAEMLRQHYENGNLSSETISQILSENSIAKSKPFTIKTEIIERYFGIAQGKNEIEKIVIEALQFYFNSK